MNYLIQTFSVWLLMAGLSELRPALKRPHDASGYEIEVVKRESP